MLSRFRHIFVPVDISDKNLPVLDVAFELAVQNRSSVTLLHVIEAIRSNDDEFDTLDEPVQRLAETELETLTQRFVDAGVPVEWKTRQGERVPEIVRFASERNVDLVVLGTHRAGEECLEEETETLNQQISDGCRCPILLVK